MYVDFSMIEGTHVDRPFERELKLAMSPDTLPQVEKFTLIVSTLAPGGGCTDFHSHHLSGELMIFMSGHGQAWLGSCRKRTCRN